MGGFGDKPAKSKSWASTEEYRNLYQQQIEPSFERMRQAIQQSGQMQRGMAGDLTNMLASQGQNQIATMLPGMGATPGAMSGAYGNIMSQLMPGMMQAQLGVEQNLLAQQLGIDQNLLQAYNNLAALSGGSTQKGAKQGWGSMLGKGLGLGAQFLPGIGQAYAWMTGAGATPETTQAG